jgi:glycopeptide antibiotics resistance protein
MRELINKIPKDKFVHFVKGLLVFTVALIFSDNVIFSFLSSIVASMIVEAWQAGTKSGKAEFTDILADTIGGLAGVLIYYAPMINSKFWW